MFLQIDPKEINKFSDLPLSYKTLKGLKENGFIEPTEIQKESIGYALQGSDILGAAKTGSGKTLAFLIPVSIFLYLLFFIFFILDMCINFKHLRISIK